MILYRRHALHLRSPALLASSMTLALLAGACQTRGAKDDSMSSTTSVVMEEISRAQGANRMLLSPGGRWLALEYALSVEQPLVVRLDRHGNEPPRAARGFLGGPPGDDGTLFYVEQEGPRDLFGTPPEQRRSHVRKLGEPGRIYSLDGAYRVWADDGRLVMLGRSGPDVEALVLDGDGTLLARRATCPGVPHLVAGGRAHILCVQRGDAAEPRDTLTVVTLAVSDLVEQWRRDILAPAIMFFDLQLGLDARGTRLLIVSRTSPKALTLDVETGAPGPLLHLPFAGVLDFVHAASPREDALLLWTKSGRHATSRRGWKLFRVHGDAVNVAVDRPDDLPPGAAARDDGRVLLAPFGAPRHSDRSTWGPEVLRYLELIETGP